MADKAQRLGRARSDRGSRKADVQKQGRERARKHKVEHIIQEQDGTIGERNSYGGDSPVGPVARRGPARFRRRRPSSFKTALACAPRVLWTAERPHERTFASGGVFVARHHARPRRRAPHGE
jgi:hypothetical protein